LFITAVKQRKPQTLPIQTTRRTSVLCVRSLRGSLLRAENVLRVFLRPRTVRASLEGLLRGLARALQWSIFGKVTHDFSFTRLISFEFELFCSCSQLTRIAGVPFGNILPDPSIQALLKNFLSCASSCISKNMSGSSTSAERQHSPMTAASS
jgi:hypothetical protein